MDTIQVEEIAVDVEGIPLCGFLAQPGTPAPGVIVLHSWWGLTPFFKDFCRRLAGEGFTVFAPDLHQGKTASTAAEAEQLLAERDFESTRQSAASAVTWLHGRLTQNAPGPSSPAGIGVIGFSMGASWALVLSTAAPEKVQAVVLFYGVEGVDFTQAQARFEGHYGELDEWTPVVEAEAMQADVQAAGLDFKIYRYPEAGHWFFEADRPEAYRPTDAELAYARTVDFFQRELLQAKSGVSG